MHMHGPLMYKITEIGETGGQEVTVFRIAVNEQCRQSSKCCRIRLPATIRKSFLKENRAY